MENAKTGTTAVNKARTETSPEAKLTPARSLDVHGWRPIGTAPRGEIVMTKIHDSSGERNVTKLKATQNGRLWLLPDGSMYVYYTPTHWRPA